jgi:hypothetical protein
MAQMEIFTDINFSGDASGGIDYDVPNMGEFWNDKISSIKVYNGEWTFCSDVDYGDVCLVLSPGEYPDVTQLDSRFNDVISSARASVQF